MISEAPEGGSHGMISGAPEGGSHEMIRKHEMDLGKHEMIAEATRSYR